MQSALKLPAACLRLGEKREGLRCQALHLRRFFRIAVVGDIIGKVIREIFPAACPGVGTQKGGGRIGLRLVKGAVLRWESQNAVQKVPELMDGGPCLGHVDVLFIVVRGARTAHPIPLTQAGQAPEVHRIRPAAVRK